MIHPSNTYDPQHPKISLSSEKIRNCGSRRWRETNTI